MKVVIIYVCLLLLSGCSYIGLGAEAMKGPSGNMGDFKVGRPYQVQGQWYYPQESYTYDETGIASWYGPGFHHEKTANGERYDQRELTAAHRTLQMPSFVRVTNLQNGKSVVVRVNDRGPFARSRIIDVSEKAAELLDFKRSGIARVRVQVLPKASREIALAAKEGRSWNGNLPAEVAENTARAAPRPYELSGQPVPSHQVNDVYYPDPVITPQAVPASTQLYIQAGSFSVSENAQRLANQLQNYGHAYVSDYAVINSTYHRVRMGPYASVDEATAVMGKIGMIAPDARIIVE